MQLFMHNAHGHINSVEICMFAVKMRLAVVAKHAVHAKPFTK